ncbi:MAG TPA: hypothetical protein VGN12_18965 [Pirellulales bacterium]
MNSPFGASPLSIAREAQHMAGKADGIDCKAFQKMALVTLGVTAAAAASQVFLQLWKELRRRDEREHGRSGGRGR